ncbi:MAG: META domain-containing protein [Spirochaetaceae bacterium]|nr:MAG: META domain-containing protein [Spirochaetaceae bacterium]
MNRVLVLTTAALVLLSGCTALQSALVSSTARPTPETRPPEREPAREELQTELVGAYIARVPAASSPGREITLVLYADGTARLHTDFRNNEMPVIELGSWSVVDLAADAPPEATLELILTRGRQRVYEQPERVVFGVSELGQPGTLLTALEYDRARFGEEGLQLERYNREPTPSISGTEWQLVEIQMMNDRVFVPQTPSHYTAQFASEGSFSARADCNRLSGSYADIDSQLLLGPIASTKALCPAGSLYEIYTNAIHAAHSYVLQDGEFYLSFGPDSGIMRFEPVQ